MLLYPRKGDGYGQHPLGTLREPQRSKMAWVALQSKEGIAFTVDLFEPSSKRVDLGCSCTCDQTFLCHIFFSKRTSVVECFGHYLLLQLFLRRALYKR